MADDKKGKLADLAALMSSLSKNIQTYTYLRGKVELELEVDIDAFTSDYFRAVRKRMKERFATLVAQDAMAREKMITTIVEEHNKKAEDAKAETAIAVAGQELKQNLLTREEVEKKLDLPPLIDPEAATAYLENEAKSLDTKKDILIELLRGDLDENPEGSGVLVSWKIPNVDVPCTRESLRALSPRALDELWEFCSEKANTVKKTPASPNNQTTSGTTGAGSQGQADQPDLTM